MRSLVNQRTGLGYTRLILGLSLIHICPEELIGKTLVEVSPDFYRPTDVVNLWGDPTKAKAELNCCLLYTSSGCCQYFARKV